VNAINDDSGELKKQIERLDEHYRRLVESISEGVSVMTLEGVITSVSPAIEQLSGWSSAELLGSHVQSLIHPADLPLAIEHLQRLSNGQRLRPIKLRMLQKTGEYRSVEVFSELEVEDGQVSGVWSLTRDLSRDVQLAKQSEEITQERRRVQSLVDLIHATAVRVASPLTSIALATFSLARQAGDPAALSSTEHIERHVQHLAQLIERVLTMAELEADRAHFSFAPVKLNRLAQYVHTSMILLAEERNIGLALELTADLPPVRADELQLYRAVQEVAANAIQYTPESGSVTIRTFKRDSYGVIEVQDTGLGIAPEIMPHLFERFYHFSLPISSPEKLGLGLPIANQIVYKHGGILDVVSTPSKGSTVTIAIPLYRP
jgi:PAS domain S-box-containing protein